MSMKRKIIAFILIFLILSAFNFNIGKKNDKKDWTKKITQKWQQGKEKVKGYYNQAKEKANQYYDNAKEKTKEYYEDYSGRIREGTKKLFETTRETTKGYLEIAREKADDFIEEVKPRLQEKYKIIIDKYGSRVKEDLGVMIDKFGQAAAERWRGIVEIYGDKASGLVMQIHNNTGKASNFVLDSLERYGPQAGVLLEQACQRFGSESVLEIRGKVNQYLPMLVTSQNENTYKMMKAVDTAIAVYAIYDGVKDHSKKLTLESIDFLGNNLTVETKSGRKSMNRAFGDLVSEKMPILAGTEITDDPSRALTYGLIYMDTSYLINEMKIVKTDSNQETMSLTDALYSSPPGKTKQQKSVIRAAISFSRLKNSLADGSLDIDQARTLVKDIQAVGGQ